MAGRDAWCQHGIKTSAIDPELGTYLVCLETCLDCRKQGRGRKWDQGIKGKLWYDAGYGKESGFCFTQKLLGVLRYGQTFILSGYCVNRH